MGDEARQTLSAVETDDRRIQQRYRAMFEQHGVRPEALGWRNTSQVVRFGAAFRFLTARRAGSLLDLGCGFADLLGFLRARGWTGNYMGVDFIAEFIEEARSRYGGDSSAKFICGHVLESELPNKAFDACVAIGLCNARREAGNELFIEALTTRAISLARQMILLDFLSQTSDRRRTDLFFSAPEQVIKIGLKHSRRLVLDHSYMPFEFMLAIYLDDEVAPELPYYTSNG